MTTRPLTPLLFAAVLPLVACRDDSTVGAVDSETGSTAAADTGAPPMTTADPNTGDPDTGGDPAATADSTTDSGAESTSTGAMCKEGVACDDEDLQTRDDACNADGECAGTPYDCAPAVCESSSTHDGDGCQVVFDNADVPCDDEDLATNDDVCDGAGNCAGTSIDCVPGLCEASSTRNGVDCDVVFEPLGVACDDADDATMADQCDGAGTCAGTPLVCSPGVCEDSSTPNGIDCDVVFSGAGAGCDDSNNATMADQCDGAGTCAGTPLVCSPGVCEDSSTPNGIDCDVVFSGAGAGCDDSNNATMDDDCDGDGTCAGMPYSCTPAVCEISSAPNGVDCTVVNEPNGTPCDDGDPTTSNDQCSGGTCSGTGDGICGPGENACNSWADCQNGIFPPGDSCIGNCGGANVAGPGTCGCDALCAVFNDCCSDKQAVCGC